MSDSDWNDGFKAGIEAAAKVCDARFEVIRNDYSGTEYYYLDELESAANIIRALKRPEAKPDLGENEYAICHIHGKFFSGYSACPICTTQKKAVQDWEQTRRDCS